jgi:hypothetical protein
MANRELQQNNGEKETTMQLYSNFNDILNDAAGLVFYDDASLITLF